MRRGVLVLAAGAEWEPRVVEILEASTQVVVLRRCVDVDDLLAAVAMGQADGAVVSLDAPGLDRDAVLQIRRAGMTLVAVLPVLAEAGAARASRLGIGVTLDVAGVARLPELLTSTGSSGPATEAPLAPRAGGDHRDLGATEELAAAPSESRVFVVCGTRGAPGASTVAISLAALIAERGLRVTLIDADPQGGSVAQQLGVLDEASGLLAAARQRISGDLATSWTHVARRLDDRLTVVTGVPRADRWRELASGTLEELIAHCATVGWVVVDAGSTLDEEVMVSADELIVVGTPDPVGLARLCRTLDALREEALVPPRVLLNRWRRTVAATEREVASLIGEIAPAAAVHLLAEDQSSMDRAGVRQRPVSDTAPQSTWTQALTTVVDGLVRVERRRGLRTRRAGTTRRR